MKRAWVILGGCVLAALVVFGLVLRPRNERAQEPSSETGQAWVTSHGMGGARTESDARRESGPSTLSSEGWYADKGADIELEGTIFRDGVPAPGVAIVVRDDLTSDGLMRPIHVTSGERGRFTARVPRLRGWYEILAYGEGAAPSWVFAPGDATKRDLELRLEGCKLHVYGVVSDASGGAVAGARISLERAPEHATVADDAGRFRLCMGPRSALLRVDASGYAIWTKSVAARGALRQDVTLLPAAALAGTVVVSGVGGAPVPFALVSLRASGTTVREVMADADGRFAIDRIQPGAYTIEARAQGAKSRRPIDVAVFASGSEKVTVEVDARASVRGRVVSNDVPVTSATVNVGFAATSEWGTSVRTGPDGAFTIEDAPIGNLFVKVDDWDVETPKTITVPAAGVEGVALRVVPRGELAVTVTHGGAPIRDATVQIRGPGASDSKTTSALGVATFRGLPAGTFRASAEHEEGFVVAESIAVTREKPASVSLELGAGRQVEGRVVDDEGQPVDGARVAFVPSSTTIDTGAAAITGADGSFRGGPLRGPASYRLEIKRSGFDLEIKGEPPRLDVPEKGPVTPRSLSIVVGAQNKDVAGRVVDSAGGPMRDVRVIVTRPQRHGDTLATTFTGNDGTFSLHHLGAGPYAVKAFAPSGAEAEESPVKPPVNGLTLTLPETGSIEGALDGFSRTPSVMAWKIVGYEWDFRPARIEGNRYVVAGLSRGRYHIAASTPDGAAQATVEVAGTAPVRVDLIASGKRTIRGRLVDLVTGQPLPGLQCQAAPDLGDTRSPVVVPGVVYTTAAGEITFTDVPTTPLYMWCNGEGSLRGGAARMPSDLGADHVFTAYGLDTRGKPSVDTRAMGLTFAEDHPFSRRLVSVEPKGPAERSGLRAGDVFDKVGDRAVDACGNGTVRSYLALLLAEAKRVPVVISRDGRTVALTFTLP